MIQNSPEYLRSMMYDSRFGASMREIKKIKPRILNWKKCGYGVNTDSLTAESKDLCVREKEREREHVVKRSVGPTLANYIVPV